MKRKKKFLDAADEADPTTGLTNLFDVMLVLAVGFLIFSFIAVVSNPNMMNMESTGQNPNTVSVSTGETLDENISNGTGSSSNYQEMGKVYKDPETNKLIMVS